MVLQVGTVAFPDAPHVTHAGMPLGKFGHANCGRPR